MTSSLLAPTPRVEWLPEVVRERLARAAALGRRRGEAVYLVGGMVRDLLLGRDSLDVDLVIEGDGLAFAADLARESAAPLRRHPEFQTAQIDDPALGPLDVATARRETYPAPGALPVVTPAPIAEDLGRRDFAVNALALRLDREGFCDPWQGLADLAAGRLRVLHERSFVDDPTRILRGVRLGARLGFAFDAATDRWARDAIADGAFAPLSGARLRGELELLAACPPEVLATAEARLAELDFFARALGLPPPAPETSAPRPNPGGDPLLCLLLRWTPEAAEMPVADRLQLVGPRRQALVGARGRARRARAVLTRPGVRPSAAHEALAALGPEELEALVPEPAPVGSWAREDRDRLRPLSLTLRGGDLVAHGVPPGPRVGRILAAVRRERLDGELGPEGELARALELAGEGA